MKLLIASTLKAGCLVVVMSAGMVAHAQAQTLTWTDQGFVNLNLGGQAGSSDITTNSTFEIYLENAALSTSQEAGGGGLFDISGGYKVWRNLALGLGYSRVGSDSDAAIAAAIPDLDFFDRTRPVSGTASGMNHTEHAFHLQGTWIRPVTDKVDVGFSFGPTIFRVSSDIPSAVEVTEPGPTLTTITSTRQKKTTVGINLGVDANYFFTPRYGAGVLLRYTWGSVDFDGADDSVSVGGFQIGVGFRYRFQSF